MTKMDMLLCLADLPSVQSSNFKLKGRVLTVQGVVKRTNLKKVSLSFYLQVGKIFLVIYSRERLSFSVMQLNEKII